MFIKLVKKDGNINILECARVKIVPGNPDRLDLLSDKIKTAWVYIYFKDREPEFTHRIKFDEKGIPDHNVFIMNEAGQTVDTFCWGAENNK